MNEVVELLVLDNYRIQIKFKDEEIKVVNIRPFLGKEFTADLLDYDKFNKVFIEPCGGIAWSNGYDFCPNFLKELASEKITA